VKAKCSLVRCTSGKPGLWEPIVLLWPERVSFLPAQPASINIIGHALCGECVARVTVRDVIPTYNEWDKIVKHFNEQKKAKPSFRTAKLTFMIPETRVEGGSIL
jgi:hypothetical protein